jgi:hypothetical protein
MTEDTPSRLGNVVTIDDERIKSHLDRVVRGSVEETLNALLDAEADRLCNAERTSAARPVAIGGPVTTSASSDQGRRGPTAVTGPGGIATGLLQRCQGIQQWA